MVNRSRSDRPSNFGSDKLVHTGPTQAPYYPLPAHYLHTLDAATTFPFFLVRTLCLSATCLTFTLHTGLDSPCTRHCSCFFVVPTPTLPTSLGIGHHPSPTFCTIGTGHFPPCSGALGHTDFVLDSTLRHILLARLHHNTALTKLAHFLLFFCRRSGTPPHRCATRNTACRAYHLTTLRTTAPPRLTPANYPTG